ncbi:hypothetical protein [Bacillus sp. Brlt_9]|uniref:hypothetical protein n=1 Tax=Bacillus sp. Brlt_9 TaxID=3110916 RepID=UPI003F7B4AD8
MKKILRIRFLLLIFCLFATAIILYADKKEEKYYSIMLNEKGQKSKIEKVKKLIEKEYQIYNLFQGREYLTIVTDQNIDLVKSKIGKYGNIEEIKEDKTVSTVDISGD